MSIRINKENCVGCGRCVEACPGNLIKLNAERRAEIRHVRDCWGCTSCLKECRFHAIVFFLGADVGGRGSTLSYEEKGALARWTVTAPDGRQNIIDINKKDANRY